MKLAVAALATLIIAGTANAGVLTLESRTANGPHDFTFSYRGTLGPDEGVVSGDKLVIFDFVGYISGSEFSSIPTVLATVELTSPGTFVTPGFNDDPTIPNLVFTYTGPPFRADGGPFPPFSFEGIGARSIHGGLNADAFFGLSTKNNPASEAGSKIYTLGQAAVPAPIPELATWALMLGGFGLLGGAFRARAHGGLRRA